MYAFAVAARVYICECLVRQCVLLLHNTTTLTMYVC